MQTIGALAVLAGAGTAFGQVCPDLGLNSRDWLEYPGANPLPLVNAWSFASNPADTTLLSITTTDADTVLAGPGVTDPRRRQDTAAEVDGFPHINAATGSIEFPMMQFSAINGAGGDVVRFQIEYTFSNPLPAGSSIVLAKFGYNRSTGERTRATATAYDTANAALPPSTLSHVANYDRVGRSGFQTLAWDLAYDSGTGEFGHIMPALLAGGPSINTDWIEVTNSVPLSRLVFDVTDCTCTNTNEAFKIAIGKPDGRVREGKYHGLIGHAAPDTYNTGSALFEVDNRNRFSAKFNYDGIVYRFGGTFSAIDNDWAGVVTSPDGPPITVAVDVGPDMSATILALMGTITGVHGTSTFEALYSPWDDPDLPCGLPVVGDYTALVAPPSPMPGLLPEGYCYTNGQVQPSGRAAFYTRTTDGIVGFAGGYVSGIETFGFHARTNTLAADPDRTNSIIGPVVFQDIAGVSDFDGSVTVYKTSDTKDQFYYPAGYEYASTIIGSLYVPPAADAYPASSLEVDGGSIATGITIAGPTATFSNVVDIRSMNWLPSTGELFGIYNNADDSRRRPYGGVLFQKQGLGAGNVQGARINPPSGTPMVGSFLITP